MCGERTVGTVRRRQGAWVLKDRVWQGGAEPLAGGCPSGGPAGAAWCLDREVAGAVSSEHCDACLSRGGNTWGAKAQEVSGRHLVFEVAHGSL